MLREAERHARSRFTAHPPAEDPHLTAWRDTFRAFGAKPQRTMNSAEALITRVVKGNDLPVINRLMDVYNAVSVACVVPCGGEDLAHVVGNVTLKVADGTEVFETSKDGAPAIDHPVPGEVVWADEAGATCRAWNWRQGTRTRLTEDTTDAYFLLDALGPMTADELNRAGDALEAGLQAVSPGCRVHRLHLGSVGQ